MERIPLHLIMNCYLSSSQIELLQESIEAYVEKLQWSTRLTYNPESKIDSLLQINRILMNSSSTEEVEDESLHPICDL